MYIVGIDIAKRKHEAAVIDGEGTVIIKPFSFTNNCSGYCPKLCTLHYPMRRGCLSSRPESPGAVRTPKASDGE